MARGFDAIPTAESWQLSNSPILILPHIKHRSTYSERPAWSPSRKRKMLAAYIRFILDKIIADKGSEVTEVITPANENERGCQVSILMHQRGGKHLMHSPSTALLPIGANRMLSALRLFLVQQVYGYLGVWPDRWSCAFKINIYVEPVWHLWHRSLCHSLVCSVPYASFKTAAPSYKQQLITFVAMNRQQLVSSIKRKRPTCVWSWYRYHKDSGLPASVSQCHCWI